METGRHGDATETFVVSFVVNLVAFSRSLEEA